MAETTPGSKSTTSRPKATKAKAATPRATSGRAAGGTKKASAANGGASPAKAKFARALEEARAGAQELGKQAAATAGAYREKLAGDWVEEARTMSGQAKTRAADLARDGKTRASDAISGLGKIVADNAATIDEKLGVKYGDYARQAARTMQESAAKLEAKDLNELGEDAREFVRKSPGLAIGMAAVAGFMLSRMFKGSDD